MIFIGQVPFDKLEDESLTQIEIVLVGDFYTSVPIKILITYLVDACHL
jgi:hypothetical protein